MLEFSSLLYDASTYSVVLVRLLHKPHNMKKIRPDGICMFLLIIYSIDSDKKKRKKKENFKSSVVQVVWIFNSVDSWTYKNECYQPQIFSQRRLDPGIKNTILYDDTLTFYRTLTVTAPWTPFVFINHKLQFFECKPVKPSPPARCKNAYNGILRRFPGFRDSVDSLLSIPRFQREWLPRGHNTSQCINII